MLKEKTRSEPQKSLSEVREAFLALRQRHYSSRRKITGEVIRQIQSSKKSAQSHNSPIAGV